VTGYDDERGLVRVVYVELRSSAVPAHAPLRGKCRPPSDDVPGTPTRRSRP
jgi:hypothetical protein